MLVVTVEFLHGIFRAAGSDDATLTGRGIAEWPPSPARVFQALVAASGARARTGLVDASVLDLLAGAPIIFANSSSEAVVSEITPRYVPSDRTQGAGVQDYPARTAQLVRPGARVAPAIPIVAYAWQDAKPTADQLAALGATAARVGYLGTSDSPARVTVADDLASVPDGLAVWRPDEAGAVSLPVAYAGFLDRLDDAFADWTSGSPRRGSWIPREFAAYTDPESQQRQEPTAPTIWLRFDRGISGRRVVSVAETLRAALIESVDAAGGPGGVPQVIHGHDAPPGSEHCRVLPLPNAGFDYSDGRIHGACLWFPIGTHPADVELARHAITSVRRLVRPGHFDVAMKPFDGARAPWASNPERWKVRRRHWASVFPVVYERHLKRGLDLAELTRWCHWAHLPDPVGFREARVPLIHGAATLAGPEVYRGSDRRRFSHIEIEFEDPVMGPIAVGRGRHFGLGLMVPVGGDGSGD